jgi:hypothetical protein
LIKGYYVKEKNGVSMKALYYIFVFAYLVAPFIICPYLVRVENNSYLFFGIAFYFAGAILAASKQGVLYFVPVLLIIAFWYFFGFDITNIPSIFFYCIVSGFIFYKTKEKLKNLADDYSNRSGEY